MLMFVYVLLVLLIVSSNGETPKIVSATFEIQTLNVLERMNTPVNNNDDDANIEDVIDLEPKMLQAIGLQIIYDQPIFAKFGYSEPHKRKHYHDAYSQHAFLVAKQSMNNFIEVHCFKDKLHNEKSIGVNNNTNPTMGETNTQSAAYPTFSGYFLRCRDMEKYHNGYQFSIFDWPCERDNSQGTQRKHKLSGIVISNRAGEKILSRDDFNFCSLNYVINDLKSKVIVNFYGERVPLPKHVVKRNRCEYPASTLIVLPEYKGGVKPSDGAGIGIFQKCL